jgi:1-acyl-sn-glycerol-3-phosphate acyltransferase
VTRPKAEHWLLLSRTERAGLLLAEVCARRLPWLSVAVSFFPMGALIWLGIGRRLRLRGIEHARALRGGGSWLLVANHRSFFDFFTVVAALRFRAAYRGRLSFPVRSEFFYDRPLGVLVNLLAAGMSMYPPVFRSGRKRALNPWSLARCAEELARPSTAVGLHPEGTRGKGADPFELLAARSGPGRVALAAPHARVVPVFVLGLGDSILAEIGKNLFGPARHPVWMSFGREIELADLREARAPHAARRIAERCRAAIMALGECVRAEHARAVPR